MLFHVTIAVRVPPDADHEKIKELGEREHERAAELQRQGKWLHLWRVAGKWANVSIFRVDGPAELHDILESLPLRPYMDVEVSALCKHPGSLSTAD
jgi:muconolactone D-isomerase